MDENGSTLLEQAIGAEVRALAARKSLSHKAIQEAAKVEQRSFRRYFVECNRAIPVDVLARVAGALGVSMSDLVAAAESAVLDADPIPPGRFEEYDLAAETIKDAKKKRED